MSQATLADVEMLLRVAAQTVPVTGRGEEARTRFTHAADTVARARLYIEAITREPKNALEHALKNIGNGRSPYSEGNGEFVDEFIRAVQP
jgi:hypothetical protein